MKKSREVLTEVICMACDGTGLSKVTQPAKPGRKIYPANCTECLGKGRITPIFETIDFEAPVTAITKAVSRAFLSASRESEIFKQLVMSVCAGLFVYLLLLTYGLDLSPGLF